ncbi:MAG: SHOCT domain-containing protein [Pseudonocardiaceae bacterium]
MCGWAMGLFWIWPVLILIGLLVLGYVAARLMRSRGLPSLPGFSSAQQILDERYARGEIDEEEYRRRRAELTSR